ncbi:MAG: alpha-L-fucosidase [Candidatus Latescibacteria bacterium]|nr:alpha-L-fucosidase [Candidatus Latescibacterota bacterium]
MQRRLIHAALLLLCSQISTWAQEIPAADRLAWFRDARLGIFIHWGIYAVDGIDESWSFFNGYLSYDDYMAQLDGFTAAHYDPQAWADLIAGSGARYAVLTTKHHDGVALWDTDQSDLSTVKATPAGRDLVRPFVDALRQADLRVGLYFSHLDWSHPDYPIHTRTQRRYQDDPERWARFLAFRHNQLRELTQRFTPDLLWFDGDWEQDAEAWESAALRDSLLAWQPNIILNSRINGHGDYATPEQGLPITPPEGAWELCLTMNDSWGFQDHDRNYKTPYQIVRIFADVLAGGGNLLLDIGPRADGTIPPQQIDILTELGRWTDKHAEAIYGTTAGIEPGHFYGPTTLSKDRQTLYLFLPHRPSGPVVIKGLKNAINRIRIVGNGTKLPHQILGKQYWSQVPGLLYIDVPATETDTLMTVLALQLKGPVDLYRE